MRIFFETASELAKYKNSPHMDHSGVSDPYYVEE